MRHATDELERGRESYARRAWRDAYEALSGADQAQRRWSGGPRAAGDVRLHARPRRRIRERPGARPPRLRGLPARRCWPCAARSGWASISLLEGRWAGRRGGSAARSGCVDREERDCVEQGYLLLPARCSSVWPRGDYDAAYARRGDGRRRRPSASAMRDLLALAVHKQGHALVKQGRVEEGLGLLDEAMVAVTAGELSPIVTGLVYCSVIEGCQEVHELRRAQEWTAALTRWCEQQPDMVAFTGRAWCTAPRSCSCAARGRTRWRRRGAPASASRRRRTSSGAADAVLPAGGGPPPARRVFAAAEEAYREASRCGWEPQPGLALLRLAQGNSDAAAAAIRRGWAETDDRLTRARLLPALRRDHARRRRGRGGARRLPRARRDLGRARARDAGGDGGARPGAVELARATPRPRSSRCATRGASGRSSRSRTRPPARACWSGSPAARWATTTPPRWSWRPPATLSHELGAAPDLARIDGSSRAAAPADAHGLTQRELQVLRLVAAGETNKAIAASSSSASAPWTGT